MDESTGPYKNGGCPVTEYITLNGAETGYASLTCRVLNGLARSGVRTMDELAAASPEKLARIRNIGAKSLEMILLMRDMYTAEINETVESRNHRGE